MEATKKYLVIGGNRHGDVITSPELPSGTLVALKTDGDERKPYCIHNVQFQMEYGRLDLHLLILPVLSRDMALDLAIRIISKQVEKLVINDVMETLLKILTTDGRDNVRNN